MEEYFRRAKSEWLSAVQSGPLGPGIPKIETNAVPVPRLALLSRGSLVRIPAGGPRASPTQFRKNFLRVVGEGLKVNRPKAERSHPGVCLSRRPVWDRPLRSRRDDFSASRRGGCPHPPARVQTSGCRGDPYGLPYRVRNQAPFPFVGAAHWAARRAPPQRRNLPLAISKQPTSNPKEMSVEYYGKH